MNVRQLLKITRKIFLLEHRISKEYAHDNNKKKLKQSETNLQPTMWDSKLNWIKRKRWKYKAWKIIFGNETFSLVSKPEVRIFGLVNSCLVYMYIHKF